jgi:signal transduction histidine kinase
MPHAMKRTSKAEAYARNGHAKDAFQRTHRASETKVAGLQARVHQLEAAIAEAKNTSEQIASRAFSSAKAQNAHAAEREDIMAGLHHAQAGLLQRIDDDAAELAASALRMRELSTALVLAHEEEQRRIGRELHDQIGQDLTALKIILNRGKTGGHNEALIACKEASELTDEILQTVRTICGTLRPQVLDDLGLVAGLQWHITTFAARTKLDITFDMGKIEESTLTPLIKSTVFRVIQEALTNVSRHANTQTASVMLGMRNDSLEFSIRDGGRGFDPAAVGSSSSTGVSSMRERLSLVGGHFQLSSSPGHGVLIRAIIPIFAPPNPTNSEPNRTNQHGKRTQDQNHNSRRPSLGAQGPQIAADQRERL